LANEMIISVASGKGGTGKTTVAVGLTLSLPNVQLLDCDVEEPNAHIFLKPEIKETEKVFIPVPEIDEEKCNYCGKCREVCAYNAIAVIAPNDSNKKGSVLVFPSLCHGCGACSKLCPQNAIKEVKREIGIAEKGSCGEIEFVQGSLNTGEAMSPPVIRQVKKSIKPEKTVIIDVPPGTSCPFVTSVKDSGFSLLVTEPTPFGLNDLILAVEVLRKLKIPFGVVINRADIGDSKVEEYCEKENIPLLLKIPFSKDLAVGYSKGIHMLEILPEYRKYFWDLFIKINNLGKSRKLLVL
jgi:MinD superfamily P-loop ATPase